MAFIFYSGLTCPFILRAGLRNSVGFNQGRIGASTMGSEGYPEKNYLLDKTHLYKGRDQTVGWCPLQHPSQDYTPFSFIVEALYLLTGFAVLSCPAHPCVPLKVRQVWVMTLSKRAKNDFLVPLHRDGGRVSIS